MCVDERNGGKGADPRNGEKDQRDDKDQPFWCAQGHLTPDLALPLHSYPEPERRPTNCQQHREVAWATAQPANQGQRLKRD